MKRNQNELLKKTSRLKWIVLTLIIIIGGLIAYIVIGGQRNVNQSSQISKTSATASSLESSTIFTNSTSNDENTSETRSSEEDYKYAVTFPKGQVFYGDYGDTSFAITTYEDRDDFVVSWTPKIKHSEGAHLSEMCTFEAITIPTTTVRVNEHSKVVKDVKVNTQLVQSSNQNSSSVDFFSLFDGNNTKVYAYYMKNGHIALVFSPGHGLEQYQLIEFTPK